MISKIYVRVQKRFSSSCLAQKLDDRRIKSSPNLTKFCRHDHKELVNTSTEGIDELLHGLGEIDEILSKIGVFSRTPKLQFEEARESEGFRARQDGLGTTQGVTKSSRSNPSSWARESTKENQNHSKQSTKRTRLNWIQNPGGHKEDWAFFPTQSQYKVFKNPGLNS